MFVNRSKFVRIRKAHICSCDVDINIVKSGCVRGGIVIVLDHYVEVNEDTKLSNATSKILQRAGHFFGPSKAKCFSMTLAEGEEKAFWFA